MSDLVICNFRKSMFIHDTEWPIWYHRTTQTQPVPTSNGCFVYIFRRGSTKWLYWQARNGISRIAKWTAVRFSNMERNAYQVWMF